MGHHPNPIPAFALETLIGGGDGPTYRYYFARMSSSYLFPDDIPGYYV